MLKKKIESNTEFNMAKQSPMFKEYIKRAFDKYDVDESGELDYEELRCFLSDLRILLH